MRLIDVLALCIPLLRRRVLLGPGQICRISLCLAVIQSLGAVLPMMDRVLILVIFSDFLPGVRGSSTVSEYALDSMTSMGLSIEHWTFSCERSHHSPFGRHSDFSNSSDSNRSHRLSAYPHPSSTTSSLHPQSSRPSRSIR